MPDLYRLIGPLARGLPPEMAHTLAVKALASGLMPAPAMPHLPRLQTQLFGLNFPNPVGLAAGFDKHGEACRGILAQGVGFVEAGTVTLKPQPGNPKPRLFRLPKHEAVINRFGFNSVGVETFAENIARQQGGIIGINLGKNKESADPVGDYVALLNRTYALASYITINISSPNTPGLRDMQQGEALEALVAALHATRDTLVKGGETMRPILIKIAPDLSEEALSHVCGVAVGMHVDGLIVSNTTTSREGVEKEAATIGAGGLSGQPLFERSTTCLRRTYQLTQGNVPLIGVGGIGSGEQAWQKIAAGASLLQLYSALVYQGFGLVREILLTLDRKLEERGFATLADAVGCDNKLN